MVILLSCTEHPGLETVESVDIERYMGKWYEIARLPNSFEKGLECCTATYSLKNNGKVKVVNAGHKISDRSKVKEATGTAWQPDKAYPGQLKVRFFWPFSGNYYIIHLDEDYQYVLVGDPSRKYLWILSRTKDLDQGIYNKLMDIAEKKGFNTEEVIRVKQDC
jgi:apolipoprotein D and lipocalin family protein